MLSAAGLQRCHAELRKLLRQWLVSSRFVRLTMCSSEPGRLLTGGAYLYLNHAGATLARQTRPSAIGCSSTTRSTIAGERESMPRQWTAASSGTTKSMTPTRSSSVRLLLQPPNDASPPPALTWPARIRSGQCSQLFGRIELRAPRGPALQ
jgi:hypothetical protein